MQCTLAGLQHLLQAEGPNTDDTLHWHVSILTTDDRHCLVELENAPLNLGQRRFIDQVGLVQQYAVSEDQLLDRFVLRSLRLQPTPP